MSRNQVCSSSDSSERISLFSNMRSFFFSLAGLALLHDQGHCHSSPLVVPAPRKNSSPVKKDLQSFSIEFAFFPDYAGNKSHPNEFTKNLLGNFKEITGVPPKVRVGGTSQYVENPSSSHYFSSDCLLHVQGPLKLHSRPRRSR